MAAGAFVGAGFLAKMLAAWLILPALALAYLAAPVSWPRRIGQLALAGVSVAVMSFWWPLVVSLTPAADRPYVGSTTDNSIWQLIFSYNGFGRVDGTSGPMGQLGSTVGTGLGGPAGPLRLFNAYVGGQIGWLIPIALVTLVAAVVGWLRDRRVGTPMLRADWILWGGWFLITAVVFSVTSGIFHPYYTAELAPAVAVLAATGIAVCWREFRSGHLAGLLLPASIAVTAAVAFLLLARTPDWLPWLRIAVVVAALVGILGMLAVFPRWRGTGRAALVVTAVIGLTAISAGPLAYCVAAAAGGDNVLAAGDPSAGPAKQVLSRTISTAFGSNKIGQIYLRYMENAYDMDPGQHEILDYAANHDSGAEITMAVEGGSYGADPYLLNTADRVVALGGYVGVDPDPTVPQLTALINAGRLRYVLMPGLFVALSKAAATPATTRASSVASNTDPMVGRIEWLVRHCAPVPPRVVGPGSASAGVLFDCAARR